MNLAAMPIEPGNVDLDFLRGIVGRNSRVIVEIGSNDGTETLELLKRFRRASFHAFEPDARAIAKFKVKVTDPSARLYEMAVSANDGEATFHVSSGFPEGLHPDAVAYWPGGWDQSGSLRKPKRATESYPWLKFERAVTVKTVRLDTWARENGIGTIDLIWADMQGAEGDMIAGGGATLSRTRFLYVEYSNDEEYEGEPTLDALLDMLPNFSVLKRYPSDILLQNRRL